MNERSAQPAIEAIAASIGIDIAYLEDDDFHHFDPIGVTLVVASALLNGFFEGVVDATKSAGSATAARLARALLKAHADPGGERVAPQPLAVSRDDVERYGDLAQTLVQSALVESGFPLRKAAAVAETVRAEADRLIAEEHP